MTNSDDNHRCHNYYIIYRRFRAIRHDYDHHIIVIVVSDAAACSGDVRDTGNNRHDVRTTGVPRTSVGRR